MAKISIEGHTHVLPARGLAAGTAKLAMRPSRLVIGAHDGFKATYFGIRMEYKLEASFGAMFAVREDVDTLLAVGREVPVGFSQRGPVFLPETHSV